MSVERVGVLLHDLDVFLCCDHLLVHISDVAHPVGVIQSPPDFNHDISPLRYFDGECSGEMVKIKSLRWKREVAGADVFAAWRWCAKICERHRKN